jgi:hypothetical protein
MAVARYRKTWPISTSGRDPPRTLSFMAAVSLASTKTGPSVILVRGQPQPQAPPQQPPPPDRGSAPLDLPPTETVDSSFTVSSCPSGHGQGADASLIGRLRSNVAPQARQRYS